MTEGKAARRPLEARTWRRLVMIGEDPEAREEMSLDRSETERVGLAAARQGRGISTSVREFCDVQVSIDRNRLARTGRAGGNPSPTSPAHILVAALRSRFLPDARSSFDTHSKPRRSFGHPSTSSRSTASRKRRTPTLSATFWRRRGKSRWRRSRKAR